MSLDELGVGEFPQFLFGRLIIVAEFPRAAKISENLRYTVHCLHRKKLDKEKMC